MSKQIKKERKVFLENLPKRGKLFDWRKCEGKSVYFVYDDIKGWIEIVKYIKGNHPRLIIKYINNEIEIGTDGLINCKIGKLLKKNTSDFKIEIGDIFKDDKRDITITDIKKDKDNRGHVWKYYKYKCNLCGFDCGEHYSIRDKIYKNELWVLESNILNRNDGCSCCGGNQIVVKNINSIYKTDPWMIPYIGEECAKTHTHNSNDKVQVTCLDCGTIRGGKITISHIFRRKSIGCHKCGDGFKFPNKFAFSMLEELGINFETEYSPNWIIPRRYDFYFELNNKKYILEMDGGFHSKDNSLSGQTKEESKNIDNYKDEQAKEHGIEVIRINCNYENNDKFEYVKQNVLNNKKLNELFNLSKISWDIINKYSLSNLSKVACEYKRNNSDLTTGDIGKLMNLGGQVIRKYLKQGNELDWCHYDADEESLKKYSKMKR